MYRHPYVTAFSPNRFPVEACCEVSLIVNTPPVGVVSTKPVTGMMRTV